MVCKSYIERTIWDGDQILLEKRADGASDRTSAQLDLETSTGGAWGEVVSLHASGIDAPLGVRKVGRTTIAPHANWQGDYEIGTTALGYSTFSCLGGDCPVIQWPGGQENADGLAVTHSSVDTWWGSLITEKTDASGLKYMRNRYYNPQTAQFTQQDPIGLAGGINLYGFAGGDPVNDSDPLGLCPIEVDRIPCALTIGAQVAAVGASTGALIGAGGGTLVVPVVGTVAGAGGGALIGGVTGFAAGSSVGFARDLASAVAMSGLGQKIQRLLGAIGVAGVLGGANVAGMPGVDVAPPSDHTTTGAGSADAAPVPATDRKPRGREKPPKEPDSP